MSVGYRVFGFCNDCQIDMPSGIRHDDHGQFHGLVKNLRRIVSRDHGWSVGQRGDKDYCPACSKKRESDAKA